MRAHEQRLQLLKLQQLLQQLQPLLLRQLGEEGACAVRHEEGVGAQLLQHQQRQRQRQRQQRQ